MVSASASRVTFPWMFSPWLDILLYFLCLPIGLFAFSLTQTPTAAQSFFWALIISSGFWLGPYHGGPTWFFYFDKKNLKHYCSTPVRFVIFCLLPYVVLFGSMGLALVTTDLVYAIYILWTVQHLCQQNVGILLLYHNHNANEAIVDKKLEVRTLHAGAIFYTLIMCQRLNFMYLHGAPGVAEITGLVGLWFLISLAAYVLDLGRQVWNGKSLNMPAFCFWGMSAFFFWPMAWLGTNPYSALVIPLMMHWIQYIGLNYKLVQRKYSAEGTDSLPFKRPILLLTVVCVMMTAFVTALSAMQAVNMGFDDTQKKLLYGFVIGLSLVHYYLDAFLWRFREPFQRQSILPYLVRRPATGGPAATEATPVTVGIPIDLSQPQQEPANKISVPTDS